MTGARRGGIPRLTLLSSLPDEGVGVRVLFDHGRMHALFGERYIRGKGPDRFGTSTFRESFTHEAVFAPAEAVMAKLNWRGLAHLDFLAGRDGVFLLIEIAPRPWDALMRKHLTKRPHSWSHRVRNDMVAHASATASRSTKPAASHANQNPPLPSSYAIVSVAGPRYSARCHGKTSIDRNSQRRLSSGLRIRGQIPTIPRTRPEGDADGRCAPGHGG